MATKRMGGEARRLLALQKKRNEMNASLSKEKEQALMISQSLLSGGQSNRIVFSDSDDEEEGEQAKFLQSDGEEEDEDVEKLFRMKGEYEGAQGQELFSQQRQIDNVTGGDKRFQMDDSFLEDEEEEMEENKTESHLSQERDHMMGLLSGMMNVRPKKAVSMKNNGKIASNTLDERYSFFSRHAWTLQNVPRYDPTVSKHRELEISTSIEESKKRKKKDIESTLKRLKPVPAPKPLSSTKRFIKTSDSWKGLFSTQPVKKFGFLSASSKSTKNTVENKSFRFGFSDTISDAVEKKVTSVAVENEKEEEEEEEEEESSSSDEDDRVSQTEQRKETFKKVPAMSFWRGESSVNGENDDDTNARLERRKRLTKDFKRKSKIAKRLRR